MPERRPGALGQYRTSRCSILYAISTGNPVAAYARSVPDSTYLRGGSRSDEERGGREEKGTRV
eukprot:3940745-Rhodomonas_salina.6